MKKITMCPPAPDLSADIPLNSTDKEALIYLKGFLRGSPLPENVFQDINPYQYDPSNLPDGFWYLVHSTEKKQNAFGRWEVKGHATEVLTDSFTICWRTTMEFFEFQDSLERRTDWVMQEYTITKKGFCSTSNEKEPRSICQISLSAARSSNTEILPKTRSALITGTDCPCTVHPTTPSTENASTQVSSNRSLMKDGIEGTKLSSDAVKPLDRRMRDFSELDHMLNGDYLELDDLVDPGSCLSSSVTSSRSSMTFDEYFDPVALLQELEDTDIIAQTNDSRSGFRVTAPARPVEVVIQPAISGCLVCATGLPTEQTGGTQAISAHKMDISDHSHKRLEAEGRYKDPSSSESAAAAPDSNMASPQGENKEADRKTKRLKRYFCFMPF